jgi:CHAD domain-containing protein
MTLVLQKAGSVALAIKPKRSLRRQLKRIARKELGSASDRLLKRNRNDDDVHEGRKSVKKAEAIANLLDQIGGRVRARDRDDLRTVKRSLSRFRDADAVIQTFDRLRSRFSRRIPAGTSTAIKTQLQRRKSQMTPAIRSGAGSLARAGKTLQTLQRPAKRWVAPSMKIAELPDVLKRSYRAGLRAMQTAQATGRAEDFHDWRKAVKNLWYQLRVVERLVSGSTKQIEELRELETALGDAHNLVVLRTRLARDRTLRRAGRQVQNVTALSIAFEGELQRAAVVLGKRLFELSPKAFARDLERRLRPKGTPRRRPAPGTRGRAVA